MHLALIAALPFVGALLVALAGRFGRGWVLAAAMAATGAALLLILSHAPGVLAGEAVQQGFAWMPRLGLRASFRLDGLGLLFALLILGIGLLIQFYARFYLDAGEKAVQFFVFLMLFQGAMLGIVLADNIVLVLIFWELTSLTSFLLIGFWRHSADARQGARMALAVTGAGGLALIGGLLMLGHIAGSNQLSEIVRQGAAIKASPLYLPALILILLGCFTKSAQVPFHFWLPHAMAAPTPVSAYLHSATMVKAGIFLLARLWPALAGTPEWVAIVTSAGLATMLLGAWVALFKHDLKAILAYSTVSQLGLITMLLGFGTAQAAVVALFHILNHATFKAALFLCVGIVDHAAHTRDVRKLGGLIALMPVTGLIATVAALSMAGVPPLNGFISKEMMLEAATDTGSALLPVLVTIGAVLSVAYSLRLLWVVFYRPAPVFDAVPHEAGVGLWLPPAILAGLVVAIGLVPVLAEPLIRAAAAAVTSGQAEVHLVLWHGLSLPFFLSMAALAGGFVLMLVHQPVSRLWWAAWQPDARAMFNAGLDGLVRGCRWIAGRVHGGALAGVLAVLVCWVLVLAGVGFATGSHAPGQRELTPLALVPGIGWGLLIAATGALVVLHRNRLLALVLVAVVGLIVSLGFLYFSAPDLAMTQIAVEVVTVILMLLALQMLPAVTPVAGFVARDGVLAAAGGLGFGLLCWLVVSRDPGMASIAAYHLENSHDLGGGNNVVNVILVDFRGYDTFGEITVLGIAGVILYALADRLLAEPPVAGASLHRDADPHPLMLAVVARLMLPLVLLVAVFIWLRGHQLPGGGFVAGLVAATGILLQHMALGAGWAEARARVNPQALIGAGVMLAGATGVASWLFARPFLTSTFGYVRLPPFREFELASAMAFDTGVFLTVLGATLLMIGSLSRLARQGAAGGGV